MDDPSDCLSLTVRPKQLKTHAEGVQRLEQCLCPPPPEGSHPPKHLLGTLLGNSDAAAKPISAQQQHDVSCRAASQGLTT